MIQRFTIVLATLLVLSVVFIFNRADLHAEESAVIKPGDKVGIQFTCRFPNGEIAASTSTAVAKDASLPKSPVFVPRSNDDPVGVVVNQRVGKYVFPVPFEDEIVNRISASLAGTTLGKMRTIEIHSERPVDVPEKEQYLELARIRQRPKEIRMTKQEYKSLTGIDPLAGADCGIDPLVPGKVTSVSENEVLIQATLEPGATIETGFGKATVRENAGQLEIVFNAAKGTLVRMEEIVGRISDAKDKMFTIDFGDPFGREKLSCEVKTEAIPVNELSKQEK
jgi:FKBP-type peptidyl-prolyl cis-trans isomerase 2